jgi:hypothetical protein
MAWDKFYNDTRMLDFPYELEDLELLGDHLFVVGVPYSIDPEFKRNVIGAAKSFFAGHKSIDYTIKQYGKYWDVDTKQDKAQEVLLSLCSMLRRHSKDTINHLLSIDNKPDLANIFACSAAIMRLTNSFQGAVLCIRQCLHFEAVAISRIILEQISWIYSICRMSQDEEAYTKISPHKTISRLKEIIPGAARGYGFLSKKGHIMFEETLRYIKPTDGSLGIQLHDRSLSAIDAVHLLVLCDWLGIIGEYAYFDLLKEPKFVHIGKNGIIEPDPDREFNKVIEAGEKLLEEMKKA